MIGVPGEHQVVEIWERQAFDKGALDRLGLQVIFRGVPSDAGGPDYQDAILSQLGREILSGDIEFHVRSSDWYRHGHHHDHGYDRVVLHVVWEHDSGATVRADGRPVPVLALSSHLHAGALSTRSVPSVLLQHPCVPAFARLAPPTLEECVRQLGLARFDERADRFAGEMTATSPDQVCYGALLESLGYASNRDAFRLLAEAVPYAWLQSVPPASWSATLLEAARLGPASSLCPPAHLPAGCWRLTRIRPANHPARRLTGVALLLRRLDSPLSEGLRTIVLEASKPADLRAALSARAEGDALIGRGRADEMAVSVVLPLVAGLDLREQKPRELYAAYPSPPSNRWTRVMQDLFAQAGHAIRPRTAAEHQGLHQLYHGHCRQERRESCPVCGS